MVLDSEGIVPGGRETAIGMALVDAQMVARMKRTVGRRVVFEIIPYNGTLTRSAPLRVWSRRPLGTQTSSASTTSCACVELGSRISTSASSRSCQPLTCDQNVTYCRRRGLGVQGPCGPDPARPARRPVRPGRSDADRPGGASADDALRSDEAPQDPGRGRARRAPQARPREGSLPQPRPDPAHPRPLGEQVRRAVGLRADRSQTQLEDTP